MVNFQLRLDNELNSKLTFVANHLGIVKSSIVVLAIHHCINKDFDIIKPATDNTIRTTLRIPENMNSKLDNLCLKTNLAKNTIVNSCLNSYLKEHFSDIDI